MKELTLDDTIAQLKSNPPARSQPSPRNVKPDINSLEVSSTASPTASPARDLTETIASAADSISGDGTLNVSKQEAATTDEQTDVVEPHPCGIVCTRSDYFTIPALDELEDYLESDGDCPVENFSIGREGYGSIFFPGVTNVANLDIDSIGKFNHCF